MGGAGRRRRRGSGAGKTKPIFGLRRRGACGCAGLASHGVVQGGFTTGPLRVEDLFERAVVIALEGLVAAGDALEEFSRGLIIDVDIAESVRAGIRGGLLPGRGVDTSVDAARQGRAPRHLRCVG